MGERSSKVLNLPRSWGLHDGRPRCRERLFRAKSLRCECFDATRGINDWRRFPPKARHAGVQGSNQIPWLMDLARVPRFHSWQHWKQHERGTWLPGRLDQFMEIGPMAVHPPGPSTPAVLPPPLQHRRFGFYAFSPVNE